MPVGKLLKRIADTKHHIFLEGFCINHKAYRKSFFSESARHAQAIHIQSIADRCVAKIGKVSLEVDIHIGIKIGYRQSRDGGCWDEQSIHISQGIYSLCPQMFPS